jgi:lycopene beta-cyclase
VTYLQFHFVFIVPAIVLLALLQPKPMAGVGARPAWRAIGLVVLIALVYTTPWDNYLVYRNVWWYGPERVLATIGYVPVEEYLFFILQPILTGLWLCFIRTRLAIDEGVMPSAWRAGLTGFWLVATGVGVVMLFGESSLYMGLILAWASPVLAGLSWIGASRIWRERRTWAVAIAVPTVYLWIADRTAIDLGIWDISSELSFDVNPFGLPIEEATFFFVTNVLVVQGVLLFLPERFQSKR